MEDNKQLIENSVEIADEIRRKAEEKLFEELNKTDMSKTVSYEEVRRRFENLFTV